MFETSVHKSRFHNLCIFVVLAESSVAMEFASIRNYVGLNRQQKSALFLFLLPVLKCLNSNFLGTGKLSDNSPFLIYCVFYRIRCFGDFCLATEIFTIKLVAKKL